MARAARVRIRIRVEEDRAYHAQLIAPILGIKASRLTEFLRSGAVYFGPYTPRDARALAKAIRCFGVQCNAEKPVLRMRQLPPLRSRGRTAGRYVREFVKRPARA